jgi:hypothetical protein
VTPTIEAIKAAIPTVVVEDDAVLCAAGGVLASKTVTVAPGPVTVMVCAGIENVVMKMLVMPGWIETTVVPSCVNVVITPERLVVIVEVTVEAGITRVVPEPVTVRPEAVIVLASWVTSISEVTVMAGSVNVVGTVTSDIDIEAVVTVEAGSVMVVRAPEIIVVIVEAGSMRVDTKELACRANYISELKTHYLL